jgi:hypothetical protein
MGKGVRIHANQLKITAQVFLVAGAAIVLLEQPVISQALFDPTRKNLVALEAPVPIHASTPELMALGTVSHPLQLLVHSCQSPR